MKITIRDKTDPQYEEKFPDISYEKFVELVFTQGTSDTEYENYLRDAGMIELTDFNSETTGDLQIIVEREFDGRRMVLEVVEDSEWVERMRVAWTEATYAVLFPDRNREFQNPDDVFFSFVDDPEDLCTIERLCVETRKICGYPFMELRQKEGGV